MMEAAKYLVFLVVVSSVICITGFSWSHCKGHSHSNQRSLTFKRFKITPHPLILPGTIRTEFDVEVTGDITPPLSLDVQIWKLTKLFWFTKKIRIPTCCSYENICDALGIGSGASSCPGDFLKNCIDCTCPPVPGLYNTSRNSVAMTIGQLPYYMHLFANGKFEARFILKDGNGQVAECLDIKMTVRTVSSGRKRRTLPLEEIIGHEQKLEKPAYGTMPKYCYPDDKEATTILPVTTVTDESIQSFTTLEMLGTLEEDVD